MKTNALVLALDIGTSSLRAALFDTAARRFEKATAQETYTLRVGSDGAAELSIHDLEQAALRAIDKALQVRRRTRALKDRPIAAVSASCFWHSLLGYDAKRKKPTPIFTWEDARCRDDARQLRREMREAAYHQRTGCMLRTPHWPAKLRWLRRTKQSAGITRWMSPADWIYGRLAGASTASLSMASGTGLLDLRSGAWDPDLMRRLRVSAQLLTPICDEPLLVEDNTPALPPLHRFPELAGAKWFPALGDGAASNLGSDAAGPHRAALNVGTSAALRLAVPRVPAELARGLFCYRVDAQTCLIGGAISNAGNLRKWATQQLRLPDDPTALERALHQRTIPSALTILPFWAGERSPTWPRDLGGTIMGINYATTALDLLQGCLESTYHRIAQIADLLERQQGRGFEIVVSGGIRRSPESLQRLANVLGRAIRPSAETEASLRGAAVHALQKLGGAIKPLRHGAPIHPRPALARGYAVARQRQIALEKRMNRGST